MIEEEMITGSDDEVEGRRPISIGEHLTIEAHAEMYTGRNKINRLRFIADNCADSKTELEALRIAYDEIKKGDDTELFRQVVERINRRLGGKYGPDDVWTYDADQRAKEREEELRTALGKYRTPVIGEIVREAYIGFGLGDLYYKLGQLDEAYENYVHELAGNCYTAESKVAMCFNAILVSIEMRRFSGVLPYVHEAEKWEDALNPGMIFKLHCAAGLAYLKDKEYKLAAQKFLGTSSVIGNIYSEVIAPQDIATYGGLCALASFDHAELKSKVLYNRDFQQFLKEVRKMRELINPFCARKFASCLEYLNVLKPTLLLDFHLHDLVEDLCVQIRDNALIQYTHPYIRTDLAMMAEAFSTSVTELVEELEILIFEKKKMKARVDSQKSWLIKETWIVQTFHFS